MRYVVVLVVLVMVSVMTMSVSDEMVHHQSDAVTHVHLSDAAPSHHRHRRQVHSLTPQERSQVVNHHNALRAQEGASDMELMSWDESLAKKAQSWAAACRYHHKAYENMYVVPGTGLNVSAGIQFWYDEKKYFNYETGKCEGGGCGHYKVVVKAVTRHVACAYNHCDPLFRPGKPAATLMLLVCYYAPTGSKGQKLYTRGPACSKCGSGAGWCSKDGLCNSECTAPSGECSCAAHCYNCATLNLTTCRCTCTPAWQGHDCTVPCKNLHHLCGAGKPWYRGSCKSKNHPEVRRLCPAMCGDCTPDPDADPNQCPPVYGPGAHFSTATSFIGVHQVSLLSAMVVLSLTIRPRDALYRL